MFQLPPGEHTSRYFHCTGRQSPSDKSFLYIQFSFPSPPWMKKKKTRRSVSQQLRFLREQENKNAFPTTNHHSIFLLSPNDSSYQPTFSPTHPKKKRNFIAVSSDMDFPPSLHKNFFDLKRNLFFYCECCFFHQMWKDFRRGFPSHKTNYRFLQHLIFFFSLVRFCHIAFFPSKCWSCFFFFFLCKS